MRRPEASKTNNPAFAIVFRYPNRIIGRPVTRLAFYILRGICHLDNRHRFLKTPHCPPTSRPPLSPILEPVDHDRPANFLHPIALVV